MITFCSFCSPVTSGKSVAWLYRLFTWKLYKHPQSIGTLKRIKMKTLCCCVTIWALGFISSEKKSHLKPDPSDDRFVTRNQTRVSPLTQMMETGHILSNRSFQISLGPFPIILTSLQALQGLGDLSRPEDFTLNDRNILPKKGSYFYLSWTEERLSQRLDRTAHTSRTRPRASNLLLEGLAFCQVTLSRPPASAQMTGE